MTSKIKCVVNASMLRDRELIVLKYLSEFDSPLSSNKISVGIDFPRNHAIGIVLYQLSLLGLVEKAGNQCCSECGRFSVVWRVTVAGKNLVDNKDFELRIGAAIAREIIYKEK